LIPQHFRTIQIAPELNIHPLKTTGPIPHSMRGSAWKGTKGDPRTDNHPSIKISEFYGKKMTPSDFELVHGVVNSCGFARSELARTVCELLGWK
jgi:hypothetical protein